jgi:glutathione S-transferase
MTERTTMTQPILHHYWGSPYGEKIRLVLGYKQLDWRSCEIPVTPPREYLHRVLGDYRRTPVLQLGRDFVCDTRLIAEVIDDLAPEPSLKPRRNAAMSELICRWAEPRVFALMGPVRFRSAEDITVSFDGEVSAECFSADRLPFMHPVYAPERFGRLRSSAWDHLRRYLQTLDGFFAEGHAFVGGNRPCFGDFSAFHTVWWLRRKPARSELLADFPHLAQWADLMAGLGHGRFAPIGGSDAHAAAGSTQAGDELRLSWVAEQDPRLGRVVEIVADDYGKAPIEGKVIATSSRHVTIEREATGIGAVRVHFPRVGYEIVTKH